MLQVPNCLFNRCRNVLSTDAEMSWCRTVFFNGCRNVLVPNCLVFPVFTYPDILYTGKKVRLQIHINHKMFDMFTLRNVKKIFKYPLSCPTTTMMSDQIVGLRECWLSNLSDISLEWVGHFGRNMSDLRVWSLIHLECTVCNLFLMFRSSLSKNHNTVQCLKIF